MKIYSVGGAVRDALLGLPVKDRDFVVVGSSPAEMIELGFRPVGKDFPVFLHPESHQEYALARTERKIGQGYKGFKVYAAPDVTLEADLARRDLTINAIAQDESGQLIDPHDGLADLKAGILRHVSPAFAEDPVRILRVARFAARFGFTVAAETLLLMQDMVIAGEVDALVPERVWQELAKGLMEQKPALMIEILRQCGALNKILPEVDRLFGVPQSCAYHPEIDTGVHVLLAMGAAAKAHFSLAVRFACLTHDIGKGLTPRDQWPEHPDHEARGAAIMPELCRRLKVPNECRDLAVITARYHTHVHQVTELSPLEILQLLRETDAFRKPDRFELFLQACLADARGRKDYEECAYPQADFLRRMLQVANSVNTGEIAAGLSEPGLIAAAINQARLDKMVAEIQ